MNARPGVASPALSGLAGGGGPAFFWATAIAWTALAFVLDHAGDVFGSPVPRVGLLGYLLGLAVLYLLGGINVVRDAQNNTILIPTTLLKGRWPSSISSQERPESRLRPATNCAIASAASIMWRMRARRAAGKMCGARGSRGQRGPHRCPCPTHA
jgi:hypothetical protein